jgi:hypothetical protein
MVAKFSFRQTQPVEFNFDKVEGVGAKKLVGLGAHEHSSSISRKAQPAWKAGVALRRSSLD